MLIEISCVLGILAGCFGVYIIIKTLFSDREAGDKLGTCLFTGIVFGVLVVLFNQAGIQNSIRNEKITFEPPTSIIKTNNITVVTHIVNNECVIKAEVFNDASFWNSTNIVAAKVTGDNFYGQKVTHYYTILK